MHALIHVHTHTLTTKSVPVSSAKCPKQPVWSYFRGRHRRARRELLGVLQSPCWSCGRHSVLPPPLATCLEASSQPWACRPSSCFDFLALSREEHVGSTGISLPSTVFRQTVPSSGCHTAPRVAAFRHLCHPWGFMCENLLLLQIGFCGGS